MASLRTLSLACVLVSVSVAAEARTRHHPRPAVDAGASVDRHDPIGSASFEPAAIRSARPRYHPRRGAGISSSLADTIRENVRLVRQQADEIDKMRRELAEIRQQINPNVAVISPVPQNNPVVIASASALPQDDPTFVEKKPAQAIHVFPATAVQRGQFNEQRRTHRHAGLDLAGEYGSPIVASFAGRVLPAPGRDRGYGPHVVMVGGDDGIVYRYAHLSSVSVKVGQRVAAGQRLGGMGHVGRHGRDHLHFEMIPVAEYRRRPYGVHRLDPNDYLGGGRGTRMVAGAVMVGDAARAYAARHAPSKVAGAP